MPTPDAPGGRSGMLAGATAPGIAFVHTNPACLVVEKPSGLLAVPGRGETARDCVAARVQSLYADALVVHRLDMATSGLMVFARGGDAQRTLNRSFAERRVEKRYVAVVAGTPGETAGTIDLPLAADWPNRPRQKVDLAAGRPSTTRWRVLSVDAESETSRLELEPVTGRAHQLRLHLSTIGHPILGDALYAPPAVRDRAPRLLLHAAGLAFEHPVDRALLRFESAVPF